MMTRIEEIEKKLMKPCFFYSDGGDNPWLDNTIDDIEFLLSQAKKVEALEKEVYILKTDVEYHKKRYNDLEAKYVTGAQ